MPAEETSTAPTAEQQQQQNLNSAYASFKHNAALALLVGAPLLIAIPPRKLDLYTFSLAGAFAVSANHVTRERTGRSILQQFGYNYVRVPGVGETNDKILEYGGLGNRVEGRVGSGTKFEEKVKEAWVGNEVLDWKQKRLKEEQEKLDQGEGYADMIVDQIWDVWNQKKDDKEQEK